MQIKDRQQFLTILAIVAVALLALDKIVVPPLTRMWDARSAQIADLRNKVKDGQVYRNRKQAIRSHWTEIEASTLTNNVSFTATSSLPTSSSAANGTCHRPPNQPAPASWTWASFARWDLKTPAAAT